MVSPGRGRGPIPPSPVGPIGAGIRRRRPPYAVPTGAKVEGRRRIRPIYWRAAAFLLAWSRVCLFHCRTDDKERGRPWRLTQREPTNRLVVMLTEPASPPRGWPFPGWDSRWRTSSILTTDAPAGSMRSIWSITSGEPKRNRRGAGANDYPRWRIQLCPRRPTRLCRRAL
jgi:hypothetical protein